MNHEFPPSHALVKFCGRSPKWSVLEVLDAEGGGLVAVSSLRDHVITFRGQDDRTSELKFRVQFTGGARMVSQIFDGRTQGLGGPPSIWFHHLEQGRGGISSPEGYQLASDPNGGSRFLRMGRVGSPRHTPVVLHPLEAPGGLPREGPAGYVVDALEGATPTEKLCGLGIAVLLLLRSIPWAGNVHEAAGKAMALPQGARS